MRKFNAQECFAQSNNNVIEFIKKYFDNSRKILFISTVGLFTDSLFFPCEAFSSCSNVTFRTFIEKRRATSSVIEHIGSIHLEHLQGILQSSDFMVCDIDIMTADGATIGGRGAVQAAREWLNGKFTDIVIDSSGMSRGVCFPLIRQVLEAGDVMGANVHLLIAATDTPSIKVKSEASDRAEWICGFQGSMGLDASADALKLWVPQLSENAHNQMEVIYRRFQGLELGIAEVCPILPFPSHNPRRGDELLFQFESCFRDTWDCTSKNVIYAHESNPLDVFRSINKMVAARKEVFSAVGREAVTVLSPCGWRIGSLGMLLAALELDLPMIYTETVSYTTEAAAPTSVVISKPDHLWHVLLAGAPYENQQL